MREIAECLPRLVRGVVVWRWAGLKGVIEKSHIAYMILLILRQFGFIPNRGNGSIAGNAN
jgi:hypothetical protein